MKKRIEKFINEIGKQNFVLIVFILVVFVIIGLYQTFSLYTFSEGISILNGIKTYKFILGADNSENAVTIAAGTSKNIALTVSNYDKIKLQYGVYYTSSSDLSNVELGYKNDTEYLPNGIIDPKKDYIVTIQVNNNSLSDVTLNFGIKYGLESGGDLVLENNQYWITDPIFYMMKGFQSQEDTSFFHSDTYEETIKTISFVNSIDTSNALAQWDMSKLENNSIVAWVTANSMDGYYDLYIGSSRMIYAEDLSYFFADMTSVDSISFDNLNTSLTSNMKALFCNMGYNSATLVLDLGDKFDTSNVVNMHDMFYQTGYSSTEFMLDLGEKFDTSNVTNMVSMFAGAGYSNTTFMLDLGEKFDTSNVTSMVNMFARTGHSSTTFTLNLGNKFNTSNVTNMQWTFFELGYSSINFTLNLGEKFDTSNVTNMYSMFWGVGSNSTTLNLILGEKFDTSNVTTMEGMFACVGFNSTTLNLNLGEKFNTSNVTTMESMFLDFGYSASNLILDLSTFSFDNVTNYTNMLGGFSTTDTIYVKDSAAQSWILSKNFGNLTTSNVLIKG